MRANSANGHVALAGICADAGRDTEAEEQLGKMQALVQPLINEASADSNARALLGPRSSSTGRLPLILIMIP